MSPHFLLTRHLAFALTLVSEEEEEEEEEEEQQDKGHRDPDQHIPVPLETLGWSDVMKEQTCAFMSTYCVQGMCWCLWFISSNLIAPVHPGWLIPHSVHCSSHRSATCPRSLGLAGAGLGLDPRMWISSGVLMLPPGGHQHQALGSSPAGACPVSPGADGPSNYLPHSTAGIQVGRAWGEP